MDALSFDCLTKLLGSSPSRRKALGLAAAGALGGLARLIEPAETEARKKRKGKRKGKKKPRGERCGSDICRSGQRCCGGSCVDLRLCCATTEDCNGCATCVGGVCVTDPTRNGKPCSGCLECANGACGVPNDDLCEDGEKCRGGNGVCCPKCMNDKCCPPGSACINPGLFSDNFCCDLVRNTPCGANGDGTFKACCSGFNERCVDGECVPKETCEGDLVAQGLCCRDGQPACGDMCCEAGEECCGGVCRFQGTAICTKDGWCPTTSGQACCGTAGCADGPCCQFSAGEACCVGFTSTGDVETFCCPGDAGQCAPGGCCPAGTTWGDCGACCPRGNFGCDGCVAPVSGRG